VSVRLRVERALTGDARVDAGIVSRAIREGHLYAAVDGVATPPAFEFSATDTFGTVRMGDQLSVSGPVTLHVRSNAPEGFTTTLWNGVTPVAVDRRERDFSVTLPAAPAVYWAEVRADGAHAAAPWITSNPIYVRANVAPAAAPERPPAAMSTALFDGRSTAGWHIENDAVSLGSVDVTAQPALRMRFGLASEGAVNQFVALAVDTPNGLAPNDRIAFTARADTPMRVSVQLRTMQTNWERSVYVDKFNHPNRIFFDEFRPVQNGDTHTLSPADVKSVLFVIDTTNTKPGAAGRLWIIEPALEK